MLAPSFTLALTRPDTSRHARVSAPRKQRNATQPPPFVATMSDAGHDPTLSGDEANGHATPADDGEGGTPLNTVEENGLDDDDDDLFGDGAADDDAEGDAHDAQAYVAIENSMRHPIDVSQ